MSFLARIVADALAAPRERGPLRIAIATPPGTATAGSGSAVAQQAYWPESAARARSEDADRRTADDAREPTQGSAADESSLTRARVMPSLSGHADAQPGGNDGAGSAARNAAPEYGTAMRIPATTTLNERSSLPAVMPQPAASSTEHPAPAAGFRTLETASPVTPTGAPLPFAPQARGDTRDSHTAPGTTVQSTGNESSSSASMPGTATGEARTRAAGFDAVNSTGAEQQSRPDRPLPAAHAPAQSIDTAATPVQRFHAPAPPRVAGPGGPAARTTAAPTVRIDHVDVIVDAPAQKPNRRDARAHPDNSASRSYRRRL